MIESAGLPAAERGKREIERLRSEAAAHPDDPELELRLASLLLAEGRVEESEVEFRVLLTRNAPNRTWEQAGSFVLGFERYALARVFLQRAASANPAANLDLLSEILVRVSQLVTDFPEIVELDINPLIVGPAEVGNNVADVRIRLNGQEPPA